MYLIFILKQHVAAIGQHHQEKGRLQVIKILISQGSRLESRTSTGWTALITAAFCGHVDIIMLLLASGAEADAKAEDGLTALIVAAQVRHQVIVFYSHAHNLHFMTEYEKSDLSIYRVLIRNIISYFYI